VSAPLCSYDILDSNCVSLLQFNTLTNALARCPHCRKVSSVGPDFARGRGILFAIVGLIFVALGVGVTVSGVLIVSVS
jgi:phosphatidylinositol-4,5-bisphosphate 4-phosphatase